MWFLFVPFLPYPPAACWLLGIWVPQLAPGSWAPARPQFWGKEKATELETNMQKGCRERRARRGGPAGGTFFWGSDLGRLKLLLVATISRVWEHRISPSWGAASLWWGLGCVFQEQLGFPSPSCDLAWLERGAAHGEGKEPLPSEICPRGVRDGDAHGLWGPLLSPGLFHRAVTEHQIPACLQAPGGRICPLSSTSPRRPHSGVSQPRPLRAEQFSSPGPG